MQILPITNQPNYKGKLVLDKGTAAISDYMTPQQMGAKFKEIAEVVANKPYDVFISQNKDNPSFYDIAANKTLTDAKKISEYTVKVKSNTLAESVVDAAHEAMEMYEKFIAKGIKG